MRLKGQTVVITGGLGDIGRAIALELAALGAGVSLADVHPAEQAEEFLDCLRNLGADALYTQADVREEQAVIGWIEDTAEALGVPSLIISNAGVVTRADILEMTAEQWNREFEVNVTGAFNVCRTAARKLIEGELSGRIVLIGSWAAHRPNARIPAYCASKAALRMFGKTLALQLAPHGILVNEVAPGAVNAGLSAANLQSMDEADRIEKIPAGRWIEPEEVAWQVAHLCDPRNQNTTGSVILMDGGLSLTSKWT